MARQGFWIKVNGENVHILGDVNMSDESMAHLVRMIEAAQKLPYARTTDYPEDEGKECSMCGKPNVYGPGTMCASCLQVWNS